MRDTIKPINSKRRGVMQALGAAGLALAPGAQAAAAAGANNRAAAGDPWVQAQAIIDRLANPVSFRKVDYVVTAFGAAPCKLVSVKAWHSFEDQAEMPTPAPRRQGLLSEYQSGDRGLPQGRRRQGRDPGRELVLRRPDRAAVERERAPEGGRPSLLQQ
jgi:hypothetical protein